MSPRRRTRLAGTAALALPALALPVVTSSPAAAATCSSANGVSIIVDFGGSIKTGCAAGDPASAWAALQAAGFSVEGTQRFPTTFVCRIDGFPAPAQEACIQTPPASAYWALWSAPGGGSWSYASQGAATLNPAPGSALGLAFGAGASPGMAPPAPPAATTSTSRPPTSPTSPASTTTRPKPATSTTPTHPATSAAAGGGTTTRPRVSSRVASGSESAGSGSEAAPTASDPVAIPEVNASSTGRPMATGAAARATAANTESTNPAMVIGGGAAIALVLVGGAVVVRRQRDRALRE